MNMTKKALQMTTGALFSSLITVNAYSETLVSDAASPGDSDSKWVVGGYIGGMTNPYADEDSLGFLTPNIEYRGETFFIGDGELGVTLYRTHGFSFGAVLTGQYSYLSDKDEYDDNEKLDGLEERDGTLDAGLYATYTNEMGRLKLTVLDEITGEHGGQSADLHYTFDFKYSDWNINPTVGATWASAESVDHFYGVSNQEANGHRDAYKGKSALNWYAGIRGRYEITENWDVDLNAAYVFLGDGIKDSSIVDEDGLFISSVGVNYNF